MLSKICRGFARQIKSLSKTPEAKPAEPEKPKHEIPPELRKIGLGKKEVTPEILQLVRFT